MLATYFTGSTKGIFGKDEKPAEPLPALLYYPLGNISGLFSILPALLNRNKLIVHDRFTVQGWRNYIVQYQPPASGTPAAAVQMILDADIPKADIASLQFFSTGAAPLDPRVQAEFEERYGIPVLLSYGATEFGGPVCAMSPDLYAAFGKAKFGSVGKPFGGAEIRVVDTETKAVLSAGEEGLLDVMSPKMGPEWIHTTDLGIIDEDGFLFLRGRADGAIMRGGFKILPETIQQALLGHPALSAVAAVGVPDQRLGQVPAVAMEVKPGVTAPSLEELEAYLREQVLATYIPVHWLFVDELPKTVSLKVDRPAVIRLFTKEAAACWLNPPSSHPTSVIWTNWRQHYRVGLVRDWPKRGTSKSPTSTTLLAQVCRTRRSCSMLPGRKPVRLNRRGWSCGSSPPPVYSTSTICSTSNIA